MAAKEHIERKERSREIILAGNNQTVLLASETACLSLCSLRSFAANFGLRV